MYLDGRPLWRVGATGEIDAGRRARQIARRLQGLLEVRDGPPPSARVASDPTNDSQRQIIVAGRVIATVTPADAEARGTSVADLASEWAARLDRGLLQAMQRRLSSHERVLSAVQASIATAFSRLAESAIQVLPRAAAAAVVIGMFWLLASGMRRLLRLLFVRFIADRTVENLLQQVGYYAVWVIGMIVAADAFGVEPQTAVTGLGLTSLALGFALKDILSNFVSGLLILMLRPFELGDQLVIGDTEGSVERIELRATIVRTYDGRSVSVPNAETFTSRVTNNTASPVRRASITIPLGYDLDLRRACDELLAAAHATGSVLQEPPPTIRLRDLREADVLAELRFWTDSRRSDFLATQSQVRFAALDRLAAAGISMLPEQSVRLLQPSSLSAARGHPSDR